jgi:hypothetical protein
MDSPWQYTTRREACEAFMPGNLPGQWGKWRGVTCAADGCEYPAKCKGFCVPHYDKDRWAAGVRCPSHTGEKRRVIRLRHRYGIEPEDFNAMFLAQGGLCAVCKQPPTSKNSRAHWDNKLCVDHDHGTDAVRGLLCNDCNLMLAYSHEDPTALRAAAGYLEARARESA